MNFGDARQGVGFCIKLEFLMQSKIFNPVFEESKARSRVIVPDAPP